MNSFLNKNHELFEKRFPALSKTLKNDFVSFESEGHPFKIETARNGSLTAIDNNLALHSKYNPERESQQLISKFSTDSYEAALFISFGIGYAPIEFVKKYPTVPVIIIEPDSKYFIQALDVMDWTPVFNHEKLTVAVNAPIDVIKTIISQYKSSETYVFITPSQTAHCKNYAEEIKSILKKNEQKDNINTNTLEKFSHLWLNNSCRNLKFLQALDGVQKFKEINKKLSRMLPFVILAAGPSLEKILPFLKELKKRSILICVDTALHSCLSYGVEPDFIILVDPQYACAMHLEFLSAPNSILVTESAAWPSVFRFSCKEIILCSSMFPIGQYFEKRLGQKGKLGAGGSVATTAWDFARNCGAREIYIAGMDLGFPGKQTHIRGSQFEEREHRTSSRTKPSETQSVQALMSACPSYAKDYNGNNLLTDKRMSLFSWWFENACKKAECEGIKTYTLTKESLAINNILTADINNLTSLPDLSEQKIQFFKFAQENSAELKKDGHNADFKTVYRSFISNLGTLNDIAKKGISLCNKAIENRLKANEVFKELSLIDAKIMNSEAKDAASLVFPTERKINELTSDLPADPQLKSLYYSKIIYSELKKAIQEYLKTLSSIKF
ncbi:MAG: DUF115 domain-containing protein [Treponema sp.]|nr:DUF115 domain-containing protein [Treponema sp.]